LLKHEVEEAPFTLACPGSLLARWLIPRLDRLNQALPELKLQVVVSDAEQPGQPETSVTLAFFEPPWPEEGELITLMPEEICAVASPRLASVCLWLPKHTNARRSEALVDWLLRELKG